ncbi:hypothetical protein WA026_017658 [Henosepilachna vigintioctopunctata]|uniref:Uncharacterized protein n=1 Tax=Henosepilachna vigintioctopunctata TaxID=420089 RepID=A0AAW1U9B2_9CUCU
MADQWKLVNEGHSERAILQSLGPLELIGIDENNFILLENVSDQEAGMFLSQSMKIQVTDQPPAINENEALQYQEWEVPIHEISSVVSSNSNFSSDSDEQCQPFSNNSIASSESEDSQPPSNNSTASTESDGSIRVASVLQAKNNEQSETEGTVRKRKKHRRNRKGNEYKRRKNANMRLFGKSYVGFKKDASGKYNQIKQIDGKKIGPRCRGHTLSGGNRGKVKKQVCKQMFMHTISIGERQLRDWVNPLLINYT